MGPGIGNVGESGVGWSGCCRTYEDGREWQNPSLGRFGIVVGYDFAVKVVTITEISGGIVVELRQEFVWLK